MTPKGTKPNAQHRTTKGRFASYDEANRARHQYLVDHDMPIKSVGVMRKRDHYTLRIEKEVKA